MKQKIEKRKPDGVVDHIALALTTLGVGYIPGAPGTYASVIGVLIYLGIYSWWDSLEFTSHLLAPRFTMPFVWAILFAGLLIFCLIGIWASGRAIPLLGNDDPPEAVVDEVMGQLITLVFIPFGASWSFILAGFLLFRFFDIWKPYPIDDLQGLSGGLGICADDIVAGVYAGICLATGYAITLLL